MKKGTDIYVLPHERLEYDHTNDSRELMNAPEALRELCDAILALRPENSPVSFEEIDSIVDPIEVRDALGALAGDLLLNEEDDFARENDEAHALPVRKTTLDSVALRAWEWQILDEPVEERGYRDGRARQLDIIFRYSVPDNEDRFVNELISICGSGMDPDDLPTVARNIVMPEYAENGYQGHNFESRQVDSEAQAQAILLLARHVFDGMRYRD